MPGASPIQVPPLQTEALLLREPHEAKQGAAQAEMLRLARHECVRCVERIEPVCSV